MDFNISGHHLDITPAIKNHVNTKLERVLRHFDQVLGVNVVLSVDNSKEKEKRQQASVQIRLKGKDIFLETCHENLYAAIDELADKTDRQIMRYKDRTQAYEHDPLKRQPQERSLGD